MGAMTLRAAELAVLLSGDHRGVVSGPYGIRGHASLVTVQGRDERVDLRRHHHQNPGLARSPIGEGMHSTRRDERQFPGSQDPPLLTFQHFELTAQHVEGLIRAMMHMRRRLITRIGREIPLSDDKVSHASRLRASETVLAAPIRICRRQGGRLMRSCVRVRKRQAA